MTFNRIDNALSVCKLHIAATGLSNSEVESYLVAYVLTVIYAEFENRTGILVSRRCALTPDAHLKRFAQSMAKCGSELNEHDPHRRTGKITIGDLGGMLAQFGTDYAESFRQTITNSSHHRAWDSIMTARTAVAHLEGTNMVFSQMEVAYKDSIKVLDVFATSLQLPPASLTDLV